jgi:hypothetical protein
MKMLNFFSKYEVWVASWLRAHGYIVKELGGFQTVDLLVWPTQPDNILNLKYSPHDQKRYKVDVKYFSPKSKATNTFWGTTSHYDIILFVDSSYSIYLLDQFPFSETRQLLKYNPDKLIKIK